MSLRHCTENPSGGKGLGVCSADLYSCDYDTCAQQNFSITNSQNIQLVFRDNQLSRLGLQSTAPAAASATASTLAAAATSEPTHTAVITSNDGTVVAVGVGIGVPLGLCALAGLVLLGFARRKIKRLTREKEKAEADMLAYKEAKEMYERQSPQIYEAPSNGVKQELSTGYNHHQLHS